MSRYSFGPFELDPEARLLRRDGEPIPMAGKTLDTLILLVENRGRLVDKEELLSRIWVGSVVEEANLTHAIFTARKILGDSPKDHRYIATVAGRGYQFVAPVTEPTAKTAISEPEAIERQRGDSHEKSRRLPGWNRIVHFRTAADGGVPRRITARGMVPAWSRDGNSIYFASDRSGEFQIWKISEATGETQSHPAIQVTQGGGFRAFESSDGKYLYCAKGRGKSGLWRRDLSGGKEEPVLEAVEKWGWWALGADIVYFLNSAPSIRPQVRLRAFDIGTRSIRDMGMLRYPAVAATVALAASRDGRHLAYTQIDSVEADIMLMERFR